MEIRADLHIHSRFASSTSSASTLDNFTRAARRKGLELIGSGDCLHPSVLGELKGLLFDEGIANKDGIYIVLQCEVEDFNGGHHLLFFPNLSKVEEFAEAASKYSLDILTEGRPTITLFGNEIAEMAMESEALMGPAHYFTPYKGILSLYGGMEPCYREYADRIGFIELGLSADGDMANPISELQGRVFLTNSDAHSPSERRFGREFNHMLLEDMTFPCFAEAITNREGQISAGANRVKANFGLPPQEGRYHLTGCSGCHERYEWKEARERRMRCHCGGIIKRGVLDLAARHHDLSAEALPPRPPYRYIVPLTDIIAEVFGVSVRSKNAGDIYGKIIELAGDELSLFVDDDAVEAIRNPFPDVARAVEALGRREFEAEPGGGGDYGKIVLLPGRVEPPSKGDGKQPGNGDNGSGNGNAKGNDVKGNGGKEEGRPKTLFDF